MEKLLTEYGAEVISSGTQTNVDENSFVLVLFIVGLVILAVRFVLALYGPSVTLTGILLLLASFLSMTVSIAATLHEYTVSYKIRVDDDTELSAIAEQFEIVEWGDYPILVVEEK